MLPPGGVVFCGIMFTWWLVDGFASGYIMVEVDPAAVAVLISFSPCSRSATGTGGATFNSVPWFSWGCCTVTVSAASGQVDSAAACLTICWRRVSVADNALVLFVPRLGASVSPMEAVSFHCDSRSNNRLLCSAKASTTVWA